jgi:hypothetical protein
MRRAQSVLLFALLSLAPPLSAPAAAQATAASPDFFFGRPRATIGVRGNWTFAQAGSDWFDFVRESLTLDRGDFRGAGIAADVAIAVAPRVDVVVGVDFARSSANSEFRDFVDNDRRPIEQVTTLRHTALTGGVRVALTERGRALSSLAWIPRSVVPHVGGGAGFLWYGVEQYGDFVDFEDLSVFSDVLASTGWTPAGYANAGVELHVTRRLYVAVDGRYLWASPDLSAPWRGFEPLDLSGLRLSTGIALRY